MNVNNPVSSTSGSMRTPPSSDQIQQQRGPAVYSASVKAPADSIETVIPPVEYISLTTHSEKKQGEPYPATADAPDLPQPLDPSKIPLKTPLKQAEQTLVLRHFGEEVTEIMQEQAISDPEINLALGSLLTGKRISDPKLSAAAKSAGDKAAAATTKKFGLPSSWTPEAKKAEDWTTRPMSPYGKEEQEEINQYYDQTLEKLVQTMIASKKPPLSDKEIAHLNEAVRGGKVASDIAGMFIDLTRQATISTQEHYRLPVSWVKGTTEPSALTPAYVEGLSPDDIADVKLEISVKNFEEIVSDTKSATEKLLSGEEIDYYKALFTTLGALKDALRLSQMGDLEVSRENLQGQKSALQDKIANAKKYFEVDLPAQRKSEAKAAKWGFLMKIFGPLIALFALIIAIIPPAAALSTIIVTAIFTVYAALDAGLDLTSQAFAALSEFVAESMPNATEEERTAVKVAIVGGMLLFAAGSAATAMKVAGSLAATGAAQAAAATVARVTSIEITKATVQQAIKMGTIQLSMLILSGSGAIPQAVGLICKAMNMSEEDSRIVQMVFGIVIMLAAAAVVAKMAQAGPPSVPDERSIGKIISDAITKLPAKIRQGFTDLLESPKKFWDLPKLQKFKITAQLSPNLLNIASSSYQASLLLAIASKLKEIGENREADEILATLIKAFQDMINKMQENMTDLGDSMEGVQKTFNSIIDSRNNLMTNIMRISHRT